MDDDEPRPFRLPAVSRRGFLALAATAALPPARAAAEAERIAGLVARMTLEEKAGQLTVMADPFRWRPGGVNPDDMNVDEARVAADIRAGRLGALFNGVGARGARTVQRMAVEESRLGIPLLFAADIVHGLRTAFPVPLAEAASWDADLARRTARGAAMEGGASGIHQTYAPMVDVGRDQRWGRVVEGSGEDVLLAEIFAHARTLGFQGSSLADPASLLATPKHFAGYGAAEAGLDYAGADISERLLREVYLPPFRAALDAGALSVMSAFNAIDGVPATGNRRLLTGILREEWGFGGYVVADYTADRELVAHGFAADDRDAARLALLAGVDMVMMSDLYVRYLPGLVADGAVPEAFVDAAVARVLGAKVALGLFDDPYRGSDPEVERATVGSGPIRALAREAGRRSAVLLKNEGDVLPLRRDARVALVGPLAGEPVNAVGPWSIFADQSRAVTIEAGLRAVLGDRLTVVRGCEAEAERPGGIAEAVAAAEVADVVVLVAGEHALMSGEAQSRVTIDVPAPQQALAAALLATEKPVVVLLKTGRGIELSGAVGAAPALLLVWFLGSEEGNAVADLLFGDAAPAGRLPVSFPFRSGQEPYHYAHPATGRPETPESSAYKARYREAPNRALYPFGHGLTYGAVRYGAVRLSSATLPWEGEITASVRLANAGARPVEEVVQLYVRDRAASVVQPVRRLRAFRRVEVPAGGEVEVGFTVRREDLTFVGTDLAPRAEPGMFDLWLAPDAEAGEAVAFELVG
ncbi:MAG: glycoside hydrolase family 3 N-terminal domain-containing protein [Amaricoccus sp.]|uniref:glycoside hydrolase family 3 N-terminal domain-containing protein n=1 Tax=Amaricoccus sp. TaxID=1872485 RepID=UPI0039E36051